MRKKQRHDAMKAVDHPTWLIVQDRMNELVSYVELAPLADLALTLAATIEQLEKQGWMIEEPPRLPFAAFFCNRDGERWFVHLVHYDPTGPGTSVRVRRTE